MSNTFVGSRRRLQALAFIGWPLEAVAARTSLPLVALEAICEGELYVCGEDVHGRIARAYRDLVARRGPMPGRRAYAVERGWHGPMAWDDPDTDETPEIEKRAHRRAEAQVVDPFAVESALARRDGRDLNRAERLDAARRLGMPNSPNSVISTKLGLSTSVAKSLRAALEARQPAPAG